MVAAVFNELGRPDPKPHFTVGIIDDVTDLSLKPDPDFSTEDEGGIRALFYGLGSDGTVGANKNSVKIAGETTPLYAQGDFIYDSKVKADTVEGSQLLEPLFEFSVACAGCGETPYLKLLTQLYGNRLIVANATGCSSSYGGSLPTTPWAKSQEGRGPAWSNSLFEDNAEFGLGMRLAVDQQESLARQLLGELKPQLDDELDQVLASGRNVNVLVLDTEDYSNTGGQASKATPRAAVAKFAAQGKAIGKKDLGMVAVEYGNVYVAQVAMGADPLQTIRAFHEADSHTGPSLIIAYSHCIAHGIEMSTAMSHQKEAAASGYWPLYRYDPRPAREGTHPFQLDSHRPNIPFKDFAMKEARYAILTRSNPERAEQLLRLAQRDIDERWQFYEQMAGIDRSVPERR